MKYEFQVFSCGIKAKPKFMKICPDNVSVENED
jgi:hypothetical protein